MRYNGLPLHDVREIVLNLEELCVRPIQRGEERRYRELMHAHHYLGALPKIGETCGTSPPGVRSGWRCSASPPPLGNARCGIGGLAGSSAISMTAWIWWPTTAAS